MVLPSMNGVRKTIDNARYVCLFGIGTLVNECYDQIVLFLGREPDVFCDNAPEKWGSRYSGKECISPSELSRLAKETVVIITVRKYEDIYIQLSDMGFKNIFISCYNRGYDRIHAIQRPEAVQPLPNLDDYTRQVHGKWTLITGASRGVGRQIALAMAKLGSNIIAHSRCTSHVSELIDTCSAFGVEVLPIAAELGKPIEVEAMLSHLKHTAPQIDIVFNNAAISPPCPMGFWSVSGDVYQKCFAVNTISPIRICQHLIPPMIQRGFGRVINISSSIQKRPGEIAYACSKAALDKFVHDLSPSLNDTGVMLTLLDPGWVRSDAGGPNAPDSVESVFPGVVLGALLDCKFNGHWFSAQDYAGLSLADAIQKVKSAPAYSSLHD
ncbi:MAG: SDR family oxidoreductase [Desulfatitalea sp.]|nr:SDR family oxidoreductase [Desulfatitalea sp.]